MGVNMFLRTLGRHVLTVTLTLFLYFIPAGGHAAASEENVYVPKVDDAVYWGHYEQDGNPENGPESVKWIVVRRRGTTVMLLSVYGLDTRPFHGENIAVQWDRCDLQKWLNGPFLNALLTKEEQTAVCLSHLKALPNPRYDTDPGGDTDDLVFLLSVQEVERFFPNPADRLCHYTLYARENGAYHGENGTCGWWTRTTGHSPDDEARVSTEGHFVNYDVNWAKDVIRPAMWVDASLATIVTEN